MALPSTSCAWCRRQGCACMRWPCPRIAPPDNDRWVPYACASAAAAGDGHEGTVSQGAWPLHHAHPPTCMASATQRQCAYVLAAAVTAKSAACSEHEPVNTIALQAKRRKSSTPTTFIKHPHTGMYLHCSSSRTDHAALRCRRSGTVGRQHRSCWNHHHTFAIMPHLAPSSHLFRAAWTAAHGVRHNHIYCSTRPTRPPQAFQQRGDRRASTPVIAAAAGWRRPLPPGRSTKWKESAQQELCPPVPDPSISYPICAI